MFAKTHTPMNRVYEFGEAKIANMEFLLTFTKNYLQMKTKSIIRLFLITWLLIGIVNVNAQIDVEQKVKDKTVDRVDQTTDETIDNGLDAVEDGVKGLFKKKTKKEKQEQTTSEEKSESTPEQTVKNETPISLKSATKYDFVPGDKMILFEDFSQDEVGDFPALWTTNGSGEVRTLNLFPGKWMCMNAEDKVYHLMKDFVLPDNFIFEFDLVPTPPSDDNNIFSFYFTLYNGSGEFLDDGLFPGTVGFHVTCRDNGWDAKAYKSDTDIWPEGSTELSPIRLNALNHVIVWAQKRRLRVYFQGQKVMDLPTILYEGAKYNRLRFSNWSGHGTPFVTNIRFTTAKPDMRSKLLTEGKIVSYGIYFDVNSDKVKAESYGTLKEIAQVLTENAGIRIKIVGHTDGDGDATKNLDLSKRRAASVKTELSTNFGIDASRIETDGKGKTQPIAPNDTPGNKAQNRRVEFIKL
jgi:outer membrane protein OmpA-like peptidoglycan-associated protein